MKIANIQQKCDLRDQRYREEDAAFARIRHEVLHGNTKAVLNFFLQVYYEHFHPPQWHPEQYAFEWYNGTTFVIQNATAGHIIFDYDIVGRQSVFFYYNKGTNHVREKKFRFWESQGLMQLCKAPPVSQNNANLVQFDGDLLRCIARWLPARALLTCLDVCRYWRRHLLADVVWNHRIKEPVPGGITGFGGFCRYAALLPSVTDGALMQRLFFDNVELGDYLLTRIGRAWLNRYYPKQNFPDAGIVRIQKNEHATKKQRSSMLISHVKNVERQMHVVLAYVLSVYDQNAILWFKASSGHKCVLKIANLHTKRGHEGEHADIFLRQIMLTNC